MSRIIFYHPHFLVDNPVKGSGIRPVNMKKSFESIGYDVELVVGDSKNRKIAIKKIMKMIKDGETFEFLYAESTNLTVLLADSHHLPVRPLLDYRFFKFLNKNSIPIGLFYRDLYWRFNKLRPKTSPKYLYKHFFHWIEWKGFMKTIDHLFLPTRSIAKYLPTSWPEEHISALYPGFKEEKLNKNDIDKNGKVLNLIYVGGVKPPYYDLRPIIEIINQLNNARLILCTREDEWDLYRSYYKDLDFRNIKIVHVNGIELAKYYHSADLALDIREPKGYLKTALPIKLIETIGYEIPVVLLEGTESAEFVKREDTGWVVENTTEVKQLLENINKNRDILKDKILKIKKVKTSHTWNERAKQAAETLLKYNSK